MNPRPWPAALALACGIAAFLLALTPLTTLWDRDEPRFAQAAVEMLDSGEYLLPTFNGELRPQKPVFIYWLMAASVRLFGKSELAVRFWSPIAIAIAALATFALGRRLFSTRVGFIAMAVLALTPLTVVEGTAATADAVLLAAITVTLALFAHTLYTPARWWHAVVLGAAFGAALLTKGPVGLVLPFTIALLTCWLSRRSAPLATRALLALSAGAVLGMSIFAAWASPAIRATGGRIATEGLVRENIARLLTTMDGHGTPLWLAPFYYPAVAALLFLPWTFFLPGGTKIQGGAWRPPASSLIGAWVAVPLVVFSVSATKLPHYILPVWPALALIAANALAASPARARRRVLVTAGALGGLALGGLPLLERIKPVPPVAAAVRESEAAGPVYTYDFDEPSVVFYSGRKMSPIAGEHALVAWARAGGAAVLVAPRHAIAAVERQHGSLHLRELAAKRGWNYVKGTRLELVAFLREADR